MSLRKHPHPSIRSLTRFVARPDRPSQRLRRSWEARHEHVWLDCSSVCVLALARSACHARHAAWRSRRLMHQAPARCYRRTFPSSQTLKSWSMRVMCSTPAEAVVPGDRLGSSHTDPPLHSSRCCSGFVALRETKQNLIVLFV